MGEEEIAAFLSHLAIDRRAASTQNQAFSAHLFLYQHVLDRKLEFIAGVERVRRPARLPVVFSKGEARAVLGHLKGDYSLMADLLYGAVFGCWKLLGFASKTSIFLTTASPFTKARGRVPALPFYRRG